MIIKNTVDKEFYERAKELIGKLTLEEKLMLLTTHHNAVERLSVPEFYIGTEVARGYVGRSKDKISTVLPQPEGLAATFDRELMQTLGEIAGNEARAYYNEEKRGGLCLWGPTVDMVRDPRWGRTEEAYGEDVFLAGELTAKYTKGMAGDNGTFYKTIPTLKHFCANNNEEGRGNCNAYLPLRLKYEYYYAAFENAIRYGGARSIMA
ncbi:MAG: glycoside hydrolase family 3 protein, partial [Clostridia bacterium]|nr:glycoside hydrolase family 3 protein [Clostridia bacterium]